MHYLRTKFIAHGCAMNLFAGRKTISRFFGWPFGKFQEEVYMRMGSKFTRLVLALVCCAATVSNSMGLAPSGGSGSGKGGSSSGGGNNGNASTSGNTSGGGNHGGGNQGGENQVANQAGGNQAGEGRKLGSLKTVPVPGPTASELNNVVSNKAAAIALGKAFFWEMQFGSDGFTACATCHFNAGADSRTLNQTDPGLRRVDGSGNSSPDSTTYHPGFGPIHQLSVSDFPQQQLADITRSNSAVLSDNNNIVGSQGVFRYDFNDVVMGWGPENETSVVDPVFGITDPS